MTMHGCSMALDMLGRQESHLDQELFDGAMGPTKYLSDAEQGQIITF